MKDHPVYLVYAYDMSVNPPLAAVSDKFEALRFTKRFKENRKYTVIRRKLNPLLDVRPDLKPTGVCFHGNGEISVYPLEEDTEYVQWALLGDYEMRNRGDNLRCFSLAADETEAINKASELRDELIEDGLWCYDEQRTKRQQFTGTESEVNRQEAFWNATEEQGNMPESLVDGSSVYLVYAADFHIDAPFAIFDDKKKASHFTKRLGNIQAYTIVKQKLNPTYERDPNLTPIGVSFEKRGGLRIYLLDEENENVDHALEEKYRIDSDYEDLDCFLLAADEHDALSGALKIRDKLIRKGLWDYDPDSKQHRTLRDMGLIAD